MKDYLNDIIAHTNALGTIDLIKITGTDTSTAINAVAEDRSVMVSGIFKTPHSDFIGIFGMPNLNKLKTILSFDDYDENSIINVTKTVDGIPEAIHFETQSGDFVNDYRLMSKTVVEDRVKNVIFKGTTWNIEFNPTVDNIQRLKKQAQANSEETTFAVVVKDNELRVHFGDHSTHSGNFIFEKNIAGTLSNKWQLPVKQVLDILNLVGDKTFRISDQGVAEIVVDSGIATYSYLLPAHTK
jgi:hypothetical protein